MRDPVNDRAACRGVKNRRRRDHWLGVAERLKRQFPGYEIHHAFGRIGRLVGCRLFLVPLSPGVHRGPAAGRVSKELRCELRRHFLAYTKANRQNRDEMECWYAACPQRDECALTARIEDNDGGGE